LYLKTGFKYKTRILKFSIYTKWWTVPSFISIYYLHPRRLLLPKEKEWRQNQPFESIPMKRF
ncbi:hypothetical protein, partial [Bacteroides faecis]|uniref:hypothetical protein n=1 Tax=Bacteroides faecis TaxID=674529 RepID=UPI001E6097F8